MNLNQEERWLLKEKYQDVESDAFRADLERLRSGEPLAYVIGHVPFLGCDIYLDSHPLIPRPETEYWVEKAIGEIKKSTASKVLDLCTGSGCIGAAVLKHCPGVSVTFAEIDPSHIPTIEKNISTSATVIQSDLFENVSGKFDFILSNPPYIDPAIDRTEESVKENEPHLALYGGKDGMELINRIILKAPDFLNENGQLWIEHEPEQTEAIRQAAESVGFKVVTYPDQYAALRFSVLVR